MPFRSAQQRIEELLEAVRIGLGLDLAFVGQFSSGQRVFRFVSGELGELDVTPGTADPLDDSYCFLIAQGKAPAVIADTAQEPSVATLPATELGVRSHVGVPLYLPGGELFGTLCAAGSEVRADLDERALRFVQNFASVIAREIEEALQTTFAHRDKATRIRRLLDDDLHSIYLQPVIELNSGAVISMEALTRFEVEPYQAPNLVFADAHEVQLGCELEMITAEKALSYLPNFPGGVSLAVNLSPATLLDPAFLPLAARYRGDLTIEVTEHAAVDDYDELLRAIEPLTDVGIHLAIDDIGAGYAGLTHILELSPDVLKLDISLTRDIERDRSRQALASALVTFADRIGAKLVAEGIETPAMRDALNLLGVRFAQGYLLGRPAPAEEWLEHLSSTGWRLRAEDTPGVATT